MNKATLKVLPKDVLIDIITGDSLLQMKAFNKANHYVYNKIISILDEMDKCDVCLKEDRIKYKKLEKELSKWEKIQENF